MVYAHWAEQDRDQEQMHCMIRYGSLHSTFLTAQRLEPIASAVLVQVPVPVTVPFSANIPASGQTFYAKME